MINNAVTVGATMLNNNSATYASFAILMDQTLARQARRLSPASRTPSYPPVPRRTPRPCLLPERALHHNGARHGMTHGRRAPWR